VTASDAIWLLHNRTAGHPGWAAAVPLTARALERDGHPVQFRQSDDTGELIELARAAAGQGARAVLAAGGDGTQSGLAAALSGTRTALGPLPTGTVNLWARELGIEPPPPGQPEALARLARGLLAVEPRAIDLAECAGRVFLTWAGIGLDAYVQRRIGQRGPLARQLGVAYMAVASLAFGLGGRGTELRLTTDRGQALEGRYLLAAVTAIPRFAAGLVTLSPHTRLDDGLLDVWAFEGDGPGDALFHSWLLLAGQHRAHPRVAHLAAARVRVEAPDLPDAHADGEALPAAALGRPGGRGLDVTLGLRPRALRVLLPPETAGRLLAA
jgi:diacylglycerol kinase family enzyme